MQGFAFSDLQALFNASEARYQAGLDVMRKSLTDIDTKLDKALERLARDDVRIENLESRLSDLEEHAPTNNMVSHATKWVGTAVLAAILGLAGHVAEHALLPQKPSATQLIATTPTSPK
jgi:hypothetical protein